MTPPFIGVPGGTTIPYGPLPGGNYPPGSGPSILNPGSGPMVMEVPTPYEPGPYCFGIDTALCAMLPETVLKVPVRDACKTLANIVCGLGVLLILVVVLGIALQGLLNA